MISGDVLKYRKGLLIRECYETIIFGSSEFPLTVPLIELYADIFVGDRAGLFGQFDGRDRVGIALTRSF